MIRKVVLRNFKRFGEVEFDIPGHVVLAGPNNTGKTTLLQAIAAWELGFRKWRELNDFNVRNGYVKQELERLAFSPVAVRSFEHLWRDKKPGKNIEIGIQADGASMVTFEFEFRSAGSILVRPKANVYGGSLQNKSLNFATTFIPAMSGLARSEPLYGDPRTINSALAQGRPGEVLRNLLYLAHQDDAAWRSLDDMMQRMFYCRLEAPKSGEELICEYRQGLSSDAPVLDIASAGSGFLQVLLLFALLLTRGRRVDGAATVLLVDEPDAHLHMLLQRSIYGELRKIASERDAQLFVATHSEMIVNNAEDRELYLMYGVPRLVSNMAERDRLREALGVLTHSDILETEGASGVLYTEDFTDVDILAAFAKALGDEHAVALLSGRLVLKSSKAPLPGGLGDVSPQRHWEMLKLVNPKLPALELLDGDSLNRADDRVHGNAASMQRLRWRRYEIESYLIHPAALQRFLEKSIGAGSLSTAAVQSMRDELERVLQADFMRDPANPIPLVETYFRTEAVSKTLLPGLLQAAGLNNLPKREFFGIAAQFYPDEVHPEIIERLNQIKQAFGVGDV